MLRQSELYVSTQGEGPNTGQMTIFVRFAGCNMRCPGWPCDTPYAIDPAIWRHDSERVDPVMMATRVRALHEESGAHFVCLTGGEPFQQRFQELYELVRILMGHDLHVEVFTNGSYIFPEWAIHALQIMMDWKLAGSGEAQTHRATRLDNVRKLKSTDGLKFVVTGYDDLEEARKLTHELSTRAQLWVGAAWGRIADVDIIDYVQEHKLPWRLNVQTHKHIWLPETRGV